MPSITVEPVYRARSEHSHARRGDRPVHMSPVGAVRILCAPDGFIDEKHCPPSDAAITCHKCRKLASSGAYGRADGTNLLKLPDGSAYGHRVAVVVPPSLVGKLQRLASTFGQPLARVLTMTLGAFPEPGATGPAEVAPAPGYRCRHPGQKFNHPRDPETIDRVCQDCHAVVETVPRCPGLRPDGSQCRAFIRPPFVACSAHKAAMPA